MARKDLLPPREASRGLAAYFTVSREGKVELHRLWVDAHRAGPKVLSTAWALRNPAKVERLYGQTVVDQLNAAKARADALIAIPSQEEAAAS
jgi:hypothetical protein